MHTEFRTFDTKAAAHLYAAMRHIPPETYMVWPMDDGKFELAYVTGGKPDELLEV